ncbi:MAG: hypothetical protein V1899_05340 [Planctomycetota bacterium]
MLFAPDQRALKCPFCGHDEKIPSTEQEIKEYSFNDYLARPRSRGYGEVPGDRHDIRCGGCGAVTQFDKTTRATTCPFCGAPLVLDDQTDLASEDVITPEALAPFVVTAAQADAAFHKWLASLWRRRKIT